METPEVAKHVIKMKIKGNPGVCFVSEVGFGTEFFNEIAWNNLLKFINLNPDIKVVVVDGAISRMNRPEVLNEFLTYWHKTREEAEEISNNISNNEQYAILLRKMLDLVKVRIGELGKKCPQVKVVLCECTDAMQHSFTFMLNYLLLIQSNNLGKKIKDVSSEINKNKAVCVKIQRRCKKYEGRAGKAAQKMFAKLNVELEAHEAQIVKEKTERDGLIAEKQELYRVNKISPLHQVVTREFAEQISGELKQICDRMGVFFLDEPTTLVVGPLAIPYSHSRYSTWAVLGENRPRTLLKSFFGRMDNYVKEVLEATGAREVVVVESHHGTGWKHTQRVKYQPDALNFSDSASFGSVVKDTFLHFLIPPTFEDQKKVDEFSHGHRHDRLGAAGKATGSRNSEAIDRRNKGGVTGIAVLTYDPELGVGTQFVEYNKFLDGSALVKRTEYPAIVVSSDEHMKSVTDDPAGRRGLITLAKRLADRGFQFRGVKAFVKGYVNAGDTGEANKENWRHHPEHSVNSEQVAKEIAVELANMDKNDLDAVARLTVKFSDYALSGSVENMDDILDAVGEYLMEFLQIGLAHSNLKYLVSVVPGNHIAGVLSRHGIKEPAYFIQKVRASGVKVFETGRPGQFVNNSDSKVRVAVGGYETAFALIIPKYGLDKNGKPMFGPINLFVIHNPKGSEASGIVGAGKNVGADLSVAGHTHDAYVKLWSTGPNKWGVAYRVGTLQKITPTEVVYASTLPRTSAAHIFIMPTPGDFSEFTLNINHLRALGMESLLDTIKK
ncbi:MAG: hypothetical protein AAB606_01770 [Patescibacteria group bacterium]